MAPKTLKKTAQALARQPWFPAIGKRFVPQVDKVLYKVSGGRIGLLSASGYTGLMLTTTGAKTGRKRSVPLLYVGHEGCYYLVGSNWGGQSHPAWSGNLIAHPEATLTIRGRSIPVTSRLLAGDERDAMWPVLTSTWPVFDVYTGRSGRELRVFELTPR